jgi:hypothetical protein
MNARAFFKSTNTKPQAFIECSPTHHRRTNWACDVKNGETARESTNLVKCPEKPTARTTRMQQFSKVPLSMTSTNDGTVTLSTQPLGFHERIARGTMRDPFHRVKEMTMGSSLPSFWISKLMTSHVEPWTETRDSQTNGRNWVNRDAITDLKILTITHLNCRRQNQ